LLRFDGEHNHLGALRRAHVVRRSLDGVVANQSLELVLAGIGYHEPLSGQARLIRPLISAAAMLPPPMNASFLILFKNPPPSRCVMVLPNGFPKSAVRFESALLLAIADSKSPLMPIDSGIELQAAGVHDPEARSQPREHRAVIVRRRLRRRQAHEAAQAQRGSSATAVASSGNHPAETPAWSVRPPRPWMHTLRGGA